jgi:hypothetical protein
MSQIIAKKIVSTLANEGIKSSDKKDLDVTTTSMNNTIDTTVDHSRSLPNNQLISDSLTQYLPNDKRIIENDSKLTISELNKLGYAVRFETPPKEVLTKNSVFLCNKDKRKVVVKVVSLSH